MNKDIIYIDVDDDVTAIIGKIKTAKEKIVALVPPKRAGALQSAVNLRLLDRMAKNEKKQLVLITHNPALLGLAASAAIPVAKNLQSKPELAEIPALAVDDGDDIIDGAELPVGELAKTVKTPHKEPVKPAGRYRNDAIDDTDLAIDGTEVAAGTAGTVGASAASRGVASAAKKRSGPKIPNFDKFRKKLFLIIGGGVALIALLIWMFVFAPAATVIITASTSPAPVSASVKLGGTAATDFKSGIVSSVSQQDKKDVSVSFTATGQQDMGQKATGVLKVSQLTQSNYTLPAGSQFTAEDGHVFVTQSDATIPASTPCFPKYCAQSTTVNVTASAPGPDYNGESGNATGPNGTVGSFQGTTSGGSSRIATVVTQDDIDRANGQLLGQSSDAEKKALKAKFTNGEIVIDSSFVADRATPVSSPAVGQEAPDGKATLTVTTNYSIQAVPRAALDTYLTAYLQSQLTNSSNQKVYDNGISKAALSNYQNNGGTMTANVDTTGRIGPTIDETAIKNQVKGKLYGEVQQSLQSMNGVKSVDVQFSYFWVQRVPDNPDKITIQFKVDNAQNG